MSKYDKPENLTKILEQQRIRQQQDEGNNLNVLDRTELSTIEGLLKKQKHRQREELFNWVKTVSSFYLVMVFVIFILFMFKVRDEFFSFLANNFAICVWSVLLFFFVVFLLLILAIKIYQIYKRSKYAQAQRLDNQRVINYDAEKFEKKLFKFFVFILIIFGFLILFLLINNLVTIRDNLEGSKAIIITLITSTTATIIALPMTVAKSIFNEKDSGL